MGPVISQQPQSNNPGLGSDALALTSYVHFRAPVSAEPGTRNFCDIIVILK
jgi:hypothetical protein